MKKLLILGLLLLVFTCSFFVAGYYIIFDNDFLNTHTRAICDGNMCKDYEFTCLDGQVVSSTPIGGYVVFEENWTDLRQSKRQC